MNEKQAKQKTGSKTTVSVKSHEKFYDLLHQILTYANQAMPIYEFWQRVSKILLDFSS